MVIFGWIVASLGACGTTGSIALELISGEPIFMLLSKASMGIMAIGGIILWLKRKK